MSRIYYPEEIAAMELANPGMRFDRHGRVIDDGGYGGDALAQQVQDLFYRQPDYDVAQPSWNQLYQNYGPANGDALSRAVAGLDGYNYQNDQFVGPVLPGQQQGYRYSDYDQAGPLQLGMSRETLGGEQFGPSLPGMPRPGQHLDLGTPRAGLHTRWNPNTGSWDRMTNNPDSWSEAGAMDFSKWGQETPH